MTIREIWSPANPTVTAVAVIMNGLMNGEMRGKVMKLTDKTPSVSAGAVSVLTTAVTVARSGEAARRATIQRRFHKQR
jgi:hypothetical protein